MKLNLRHLRLQLGCCTESPVASQFFLCCLCQMNTPNDTPTSHTHTHITIPLITRHQTPDSFACSIEVCLHTSSLTKPPAVFIFLFLITPSYILRPLDITALRGSILYVQTSFLVLCVWNVQVSIKEQMYNINIWIWPRFLPLPYFVNSFFLKCSFSMPPVHLTGKSPANQHIWSLKVRAIWCLPAKHQISVQSLLERY